MKPRLVLSSQQFSCFNLLSAGITAIKHYTRLSHLDMASPGQDSKSTVARRASAGSCLFSRLAVWLLCQGPEAQE